MLLLTRKRIELEATVGNTFKNVVAENPTVVRLNNVVGEIALKDPKRAVRIGAQIVQAVMFVFPTDDQEIVKIALRVAEEWASTGNASFAGLETAREAMHAVEYRWSRPATVQRFAAFHAAVAAHRVLETACYAAIGETDIREAFGILVYASYATAAILEDRMDFSHAITPARRQEMERLLALVDES